MCPSPRLPGVFVPPGANCPVLTATAQRGGNCTGRILLILFPYGEVGLSTGTRTCQSSTPEQSLDNEHP